MRQTELLDCKIPNVGSGVSRSGGLHVSTIIRSLDLAINKPKYSLSSDPDEQLRRFEVGFLWEQVVSAHLAERYRSIGVVRPDELILDGIALSPDGINFDFEDGPVLEEYKSTFMSSGKDPVQVWRWMAQIKAYLMALELTRCVLRVLYMAGDYKRRDGAPAPVYKAYLLEFTQSELDDNWTLILNHARDMGWLK